MSNLAYGQVLAAIESDVNAMNFGRDDDGNFEGLRGTLAYQRRRPLFSGVRTQVLQLHREADSQWGLVRKAWLGRYTQLAARYGDNAGRLQTAGGQTGLDEGVHRMRRGRVDDGRWLG